MSLYNVKSIGSDTSYQITKFDEDFVPDTTYEVSLSECSCPAGVRPTCRHRQMLPEFIAEGTIDTNKMYRYETHEWINGPEVEA